MKSIVSAYFLTGKRSVICDRLRRYMKSLDDQYRNFLNKLLDRGSEDVNRRPVHFAVRSRAKKRTIRSKNTRQVSYIYK